MRANVLVLPVAVDVDADVYSVELLARWAPLVERTGIHRRAVADDGRYSRQTAGPPADNSAEIAAGTDYERGTCADGAAERWRPNRVRCAA